MTTERATRVVLVRHGRTDMNAGGLIRGLADPELDDVGREQVRATAAALAGEGLARVVASPLRRAVATGRAIAEASGAEFTTDPDVNDRDYGRWTGQPRADVEAQWGRIDDAPGVEPARVVLERARRALDAHADAAGGMPIAIVTHDAVIRTLFADLSPGLQARVETGSWALLSRPGAEWRIDSADHTAG